MMTVSALPPLSSHQLTKVQEQLPPPSLQKGRWQWLNRIDPNNRLSLAPHVAVGMEALAQLTKGTLLDLPGPWRVFTCFFYTVNVLLLPANIEKFAHSIKSRNAKNYSLVPKLNDIRNLFQSSRFFITSSAFSLYGLKETCQLLGRSIKLLESGLYSVLPWIKRVNRISILLQIHDILNGLKLKKDICKILSLKMNTKNRTEFRNRVLTTIKDYKPYLRICLKSHHICLLKRITAMATQLDTIASRNDERVFHLNDQITEITKILLQRSNRHLRYQAVGLFAGLLNLATIVIANPAGIASLLCVTSVTYISREILWKDQ